MKGICAECGKNVGWAYQDESGRVLCADDYWTDERIEQSKAEADALYELNWGAKEEA